MKIAQSFLATGEKRSNSAERYQVFPHLQQDPSARPVSLPRAWTTAPYVYSPRFLGVNTQASGGNLNRPAETFVRVAQRLAILGGAGAF